MHFSPPPKPTADTCLTDVIEFVRANRTLINIVCVREARTANLLREIFSDYAPVIATMNGSSGHTYLDVANRINNETTNLVIGYAPMLLYGWTPSNPARCTISATYCMTLSDALQFSGRLRSEQDEKRTKLFLTEKEYSDWLTHLDYFSGWSKVKGKA